MLPLFTLAKNGKDDSGKTIFLSREVTLTIGIDLAIIGIGIGILVIGLASIYEEKLKSSRIF